MTSPKSDSPDPPDSPSPESPTESPPEPSPSSSPDDTPDSAPDGAPQGSPESAPEGAPDGSPEEQQPPELPPGHLYRLAWGLYLVLALGGGLWIGLRERSIPLDLFIDLGHWWLHLGAGIGAAAGLLLLWEAGRRSLRLARELEDRLGRVLGNVDPQEAFALALLSGFAEELFFRGAVQGAFPSLGWLWAALLFALLHTGPGRAYRLWTLFAFLAGIVFGLLTLWSGNLLAAVVAHVLVNGINLQRLARQSRQEA